MPTSKETKKESTPISTNIDKGVVYLTYGSIEQIKWITRDKGLPIVLLRNPSSEKIRYELEDRDSLLGTSDPKVFIILPHTLEPSIVLKKKPGAKRASRTESDSNHAIPVEESFTYDQSSYIFVVVSDVDGSERKDIDVKSLSCDPRFKVLKLKTLDYQYQERYPYKDIDRVIEYNHDVPYTLERKLELYKTVKDKIPNLVYGDVGLYHCEEEHTQGRIKQLCQALRDEKGHILWRGISHREYMELFINYKTRNNIPLFYKGRIKRLDEYLIPFIKMIEGSRKRYSSAPLETFAIWVYMCSKYWPSSSGGSWFDNALGDSYFNVSAPGIEAWRLLIGLGENRSNEYLKARSGRMR